MYVAYKDAEMDFIDQLIWEKNVLKDGMYEILMHCMFNGPYEIKKIALETLSKLNQND